MNILEEIIAHKQKEVEERKSLFPVKLLERSIYYPTQPVSLRKYLQREDKVGIIAEFKRKSPSKGLINEYVKVERTSIGYMQAGASALSILTDEKYFGGRSEDLLTARKFNFCPILRKDFIIDEYQITEAKSIGADVVLLIAAALEPKRLKALAAFAKSLGMETLLEIHNEDELHPNLSEHIDLVGVNNRNLKTFETTIETSMALAEVIPSEFIKVSESGISQPESIVELKSYGYEGFLIGEYFMNNARPWRKVREFIHDVRDLMEDKKGNPQPVPKGV